jgi:hypothetical protein
MRQSQNSVKVASMKPVIPDVLKAAMAEPQYLVIWTGAGISGGSKLPQGDELTDWLLRCIFRVSLEVRFLSKLTAATLERLFKELYPNGSRRVPRLEFVLDRVRTNLGQECFNSILGAFSKGRPNEAHHTLAFLTGRGAQQITANVDTLLEQAGADKKRVYHYHGTWEAAEECGVLLANIAWEESPVTNSTKQEIDKLLSGGKYVVFIGYSGRDFYDIDPFLESQVRKYGRAVWIKFAKGKSLSEPRHNVPPSISRKARAFSEFICLEGDPADLYAHLGFEKTAATDKPEKGWTWRRDILEALTPFRRTMQAQTLALDILTRMGLDHMALELLTFFDEQTPATSPRFSHQDDEPRVRYEICALDVLYLCSQYRSVLRRCRKIRKAYLDRFRPLLAPILRRYEAGAASFGIFFSKIPMVLWRCLFSCKRVELAKNSDELPEEILAAHQEIHLPFLFSRLAKPILGSVTKKICSDEERMLNLYRGYVKRRYVETKSALYDEHLVQLLESTVAAGRGEKDKIRSIVQRWRETDNLKQINVMSRQMLRERIEEGYKPELGEIAHGITWAYITQNYYKLISWLALAHAQNSPNLSVWTTLRRLAFSNLQLGRPTFLTERIVWGLNVRAGKSARTTVSK